MSLVICEQRETTIDGGERHGDALWTTVSDVEVATGWQLKPEGLCRDEICIPLSPQQRRQFLRAQGDEVRVDLPGLWRSLGHPAVCDAGGDSWVLGIGAVDRAQALQSLEAPDFSLTDLAGRTHTLDGQRGKKVFLGNWASP